MKIFRDLRVSSKLILAFVIVFLITAILCTMSLVSLNQTSREASRIFDYYGNSQGYLGDVFSGFQTQYIFIADMERFRDSDVTAELYDLVIEVDAAMEEALAEYAKRCDDADRQDGLRTIERQIRDFQVIRDEFIVFIHAEDYDSALELLISERMEGICFSLDETLNNTKADNARRAQNALEQQNRAVMQFQIFLIITVIIIAVAIVLSVIQITNSVSKPLMALAGFMKKAGSTGDITLGHGDSKLFHKLSQSKDEIGQTIAATTAFVRHVTYIAEELEAVAAGDLTTKAELLSDTDIMGMALKHMIDNLNQLFLQINDSSHQVTAGSKHIADGAQSLAHGSAEQAKSIDELSSAIAEISERTKANTQITDKTARLSQEIRENAEKGNRQMDEMIAAVNDINDASKSISKIIKTIDDIAFQTNILALNAAVEAARAGQHGKGFAVVAEEVRNLASKSAEAAKETGDMIQNSIDKTELGTRIAGETAESLKEIVTGVNETGRLIAEIAGASDTQSLSILKINTGIDQVAQVVQQNSATAEESAAASEEMSSRSDILKQLIAQFRLKD